MNGKCGVCKGEGHIFGQSCSFCNGFGESNSLADAFVRNHPCQCFFHDRQNCPVCESKCHHTPSGNQRALVTPM